MDLIIKNRIMGKFNQKKTINMNKYFLFTLITFLISAKGITQNWSVEPDISMGRYYLLKGTIDDKYAITMYLEEGDSLCGDNTTSDRWRDATLVGWYYYDKLKIKIPLIGSDYRTDDSHVDLYVLKNYLDSFDYKNCTAKDFKEKFFNDEDRDLTKLNWMKKNKATYLTNMKIAHNYSLETNSELIIKIRDVEIKRMSISQRTGLKYITELYNIDPKKLLDGLHITFSFAERSNPGGSGSGYCGCGYEKYLGYVHFDNQINIKKFDFKKVDSCIDYESIEFYKVIKGKPDLGLIKTEE